MKTRYLKDGTPIARNGRRVCLTPCPGYNIVDIPLKAGIKKRLVACREFNTYLTFNQFGEPIQCDACRKAEKK